MKRTDLSIIMRTAWQMCRATGVTFAECLHKAWQVFKLKIKMRAGIVQFFYLKSSTGELRQAFGTLKDDLCPETKGDDRKPNKHLVTYYDTVAEGWRSFRMFNFVKSYIIYETNDVRRKTQRFDITQKAFELTDATCHRTRLKCGCKAYKGADNNRDSLLIVKYDAVVLEIIRCKGCVKKRP